MDGYITKEQAIAAMGQVTRPECFIEDTRKNFVKIIEKLPPADVVEVVRCKDCAWYSPFAFKPSIGDCRYWLYEERIDSLSVYEGDFCSYGARKDGEEG